jgi:nitrite reductase/ring-hydroxylating ferredoxin subunit
MTRHVVAAVDDIPPGTRRIVELDGREVGVFNLAGTFYAVRNRCPHLGGPLCEGRQVSELTSERPGSYRVQRPGQLLACPWHAWEFDITTGQSWCDPIRLRARRYPTTVASGAEVAGSPSPGAGGRVPGPYTAETYEVEVDRQYVVVHVGD